MPFDASKTNVLRLSMSALLVGNREGAMVHNWPPCHLPTQCAFWLAQMKDDISAHLLKAKVWFICLDLKGETALMLEGLL